MAEPAAAASEPRDRDDAEQNGRELTGNLISMENTEFAGSLSQ